MPLVSIIVPIYNEKRTLPRFLKSLGKVKLDKETILADDGSIDGGPELLRGVKGAKVLLLRHEGKGSALRAGAARAKGRFLVFLDADLEYSPSDIPKLVREAQKGPRAVFGSRFLLPYAQPRDIYYLGNRFLNFLLRRLHQGRLTDFETGLKLVPRHVFRKLSLGARGFDIEPELTLALLSAGCLIAEVPVSYRPRNRAEGKKIRWRDGFRALAMLIRRRGSDSV